jgi:CRP-like cAMP-binding protein/RimJ/RimL family protein N-acetyltransferase
VAEPITERAGELAVLPIFADCFPADLYLLATLLEPIKVAAGEILIRQGEEAHSFLIVESGSARVHRLRGDGTVVDIDVAACGIIGEIALLRHSMRTATVTAAEDVRGWVGHDDAFAQLIDLPGVLPKLVSTARQRLAAFITPIPVALRDGTQLFLRPVLPGDKARAAQGHVEFSTETFYRRFMSAREPSPALMQYLFEVDYVDHFVWVLVDAEDEVVADARIVRDPDDRNVGEIAFIVGDDYQHRGAGTLLMKALVVAAHVAGVEKFTARVFSDNLAMRTILDHWGASWEREDLGVVTTVIDVPHDVRLPVRLQTAIADVARQVMEAVS